MTLDIQFKIKNDPNYIRYLHENSYWYKFLNRNPSSFKKFEEEVKTAYKLRASDKFEKTIETIELLQNLFSTFK